MKYFQMKVGKSNQSTSEGNTDTSMQSLHSNGQRHTDKAVLYWFERACVSLSDTNKPVVFRLTVGAVEMSSVKWVFRCYKSRLG